MAYSSFESKVKRRCCSPSSLNGRRDKSLWYHWKILIADKVKVKRIQVKVLPQKNTDKKEALKWKCQESVEELRPESIAASEISNGFVLIDCRWRREVFFRWFFSPFSFWNMTDSFRNSSSTGRTTKKFFFSSFSCQKVIRIWRKGMKMWFGFIKDEIFVKVWLYRSKDFLKKIWNWLVYKNFINKKF